MLQCPTQFLVDMMLHEFNDQSRRPLQAALEFRELVDPTGLFLLPVAQFSAPRA